MTSICSECESFSKSIYNQLVDPTMEKDFLKVKYSKDKEKRSQTYTKFLMYLISTIPQKISKFQEETFSIEYPNEYKKCNECKKCKLSEKCLSFKENTKIIRHLRSLNATKVFDFLVEHQGVKNILNNGQSPRYKFANVVRKKLIEFKDDGPINKEWKGVDYYYLRIFDYSKILEDRIPYKYMRLCNQLREEIYCHPLASHGFRYENWLEISDMLE